MTSHHPHSSCGLLAHGVAAPPVLFAFNLTDQRADWSEIALVLGLAFVGAYLVARLLRRLLRWAMLGALGTQAPEAYRSAARRPLLLLRILVFALTWAVLSLPLLDAIGLPLELGAGRGALRGWLLASGVRAAIIVVVATLVLRVAALVTDRLQRDLAEGDGLDVIERTKRAQTLGRLVYNVLAVLIVSIALLMVLRELGVDILPMLTGAGIAGVALGFGAQWLVRDIIAGFFLILENHVRVGDVAAINGVGGVVEAINLRTIVLRDLEGTVHVFPNGAINTLANRSKDFSYYVIDLQVLYGQNVERVLQVLREVGEELRVDPKFQPLILEPLEILGVDAFLDTKLVIKMRIKTVALKQWEVGRELRRRIKIALERRGIPLTAAPVPLYVAGQEAGGGGDATDGPTGRRAADTEE
jgi:moderate conductance mechanosensitive channel